jgi:acyl-CoA dehydrogenase
MKRLIFDEEHEMFRDSVRSFMINEIQPHGEKWREQGIVDREAYLKAGEQGLLLMWADEKYGGAGVKDFRYEQILMEELTLHGDVGFFLWLHSRLVAPYIDEFGTEEQKERWLPACVSGESILAIAMTEPGAGSDLASIRSKAEDKGDHFLLNGAKTYISNGILADLVIVAARTDPESKRGISLFVVERGMEGFERGANLAKIGLKSQDTAELFFNNVKVPKENLLGQLHRGFYHMMHGLVEERLLAAVGFLANAEAACQVTMEYIQERHAFGQPIAAFQNTRFKMADMRTEIDVAQAFVDQCVLQHNDGKLSAEDAAKAKLFTSELEGRVTDECLQLHGGAGYMDEYAISRMYTAARVSRIYAGSSEIMREIIARSIGLDPRKPAS